jgi:hypothetical protein
MTNTLTGQREARPSTLTRCITISYTEQYWLRAGCRSKEANWTDSQIDYTDWSFEAPAFL